MFLYRWVISLDSVDARNRLAGRTFHIKGQKVTLRRYDDILSLEYRKCSRTRQLLDMVNKIKHPENEIQDEGRSKVYDARINVTPIKEFDNIGDECI